MLARLNSIARAIRIGIARKLRRPGQGELLYAEGVFARVLQARRAVGVAALIGTAGWVLLSHLPVATAGAGAWACPRTSFHAETQPAGHF